jgi:hypothetical protein
MIKTRLKWNVTLTLIYNWNNVEGGIKHHKQKQAI